MTIKAVLLDLDDTLLGNPTTQFTESYLSLLDRFLEESLGQKGFAAKLLSGTREVYRNEDPLRTNREIFYEYLALQSPVESDTFIPAVAKFYQEVYPQLQTMTHQRPGARRLVTWLLEQGYAVVVATNPLYPRTAIEQRLAWAGLPVDEIKFALVTTLENMHYVKPRPAYYEEVLARLGLQADEAIMVGNDWENDIVPAWAAGLNTFWITNDGSTPNPALSVQPDGRGTLADFACYAQEEHWLEALIPRPHSPAQIHARLSANLAALAGLVRDIPANVWHLYPDKNEWSPIEVLVHLEEGEREVQRPRLQLILEADNPFLSQPKTPPAPASRPCPNQAWQMTVTFADERRQTLEFLKGLNGDAWNRPARHYIFGPTTLLEMANFTAQHDRLHLRQLCQTVGKCV